MAKTTTASSVGSSGVLLPLTEHEGAMKVDGGTCVREKMNGNMWATINTNGYGHAVQTDGRVGGGVNGVGRSLPLHLSLAWVSSWVEVWKNESSSRKTRMWSSALKGIE